MVGVASPDIAPHRCFALACLNRGRGGKPLAVYPLYNAIARRFPRKVIPLAMSGKSLPSRPFYPDPALLNFGC